MTKRQSSIAICFALVLGCSVPPSSEEVPVVDPSTLELVGKIRNDDVRWVGMRIGRVWGVEGGATRRLVNAYQEDPLPNTVREALLIALLDPERFVAAHVILTWAHGVGTPPGECFNGLSIATAEAAQVSEEALRQLYDRWIASLAAPNTEPLGSCI